MKTNSLQDSCANRYAKEAWDGDIKMKLIGHWIDLAAYYEGSDGNAWKWQGRFVNEGPIAEFRATFSTRRRGQLYPI